MEPYATIVGRTVFSESELDWKTYGQFAVPAAGYLIIALRLLLGRWPHLAISILAPAWILGAATAVVVAAALNRLSFAGEARQFAGGCIASVWLYAATVGAFWLLDATVATARRRRNRKFTRRERPW